MAAGRAPWPGSPRLLEPVRSGYCHPAFRGSFSLKNVLPALGPGMGYDDLAIADGQAVAARYRSALADPDPGARRRTFDALRAYCARDTLAQAALRKALTALAPSQTAYSG